MKNYLVLISVITLTACANPNTTPVNTRPVALTGADQSAVQSRVIDGLKDPSSAQLRNVKAFELSNGQGRAICGEVNGKNSFGGYVGFRPFYLRLKEGKVVSAVMSTGGQEDYIASIIVQKCAEAASGRMMVDGAL